MKQDSNTAAPVISKGTVPPGSRRRAKMSQRPSVAANDGGESPTPPYQPPPPVEPNTPRGLGVRDPRPPARPMQPLADPRRAASRDLIDVQRRTLWKARPNDASPWLTASGRPINSSQAGRTEATFQKLITGQKPIDDAIPTVTNLPTPLIEEAVKNARSADQAANLTTLPYRYTKGLETVNDELGYGERIRESFCRISKDGTLETHVRISQLTKSGRQQLRPLCGPDEQHT